MNPRIGALCGLLLASAAAAQPEAARVPADAAVDEARVHGLTASFYDFPHWIPKGIESLDDARNFIASSGEPTCSYVLNLPALDCPAGDKKAAPAESTTLGDFLLGPAVFAERKRAKTDAPPARFDEPVNERSVFVFEGFVRIDKPGTYALGAEADDGVEIAVGGVTVFTAPRADGTEPAKAADVTFDAAGVYPIRVLTWDNQHNLGVEVLSNLAPTGNSGDGLTPLPILVAPAE